MTLTVSFDVICCPQLETKVSAANKLCMIGLWISFLNYSDDNILWHRAPKIYEL